MEMVGVTEEMRTLMTRMEITQSWIDRFREAIACSTGQDAASIAERNGLLSELQRLREEHETLQRMVGTATVGRALANDD